MKGNLALLACICLAGCATLHKAQDKRTAYHTYAVNDTNHQIEKILDTSKFQTGKVTIVEIDFKPLLSDGADTISPTPEVTIGNDGVVSVKGEKVISVKRTTIESTTVQTGKTCESESSSGTEERASQSSAEEVIAVEKELPKDVAKAPKYIMVTAIVFASLVAAIWLAWKRKAIIGWLKKILSAMKRLFM